MATISDDLAAAVTEGFRVARIDATNQDKLLSGPDDVEIELINGQKVTGPSWPKLSKLAQDADLAAFTILASQVHGDAQQVAVDKNAADASKAAAATSESNAKSSENNAASAQSAAAASQGAAKTSENNSATSAAQAKTDADRAQSANPDNQLKKAQNLADLPDKAAARGNLGVQNILSVVSNAPTDFNAFASPDGSKQLVLTNTGLWGVQDPSTGAVVPLPVGRGGTGHLGTLNNLTGSIDDIAETGEGCVVGTSNGGIWPRPTITTEWAFIKTQVHADSAYRSQTLRYFVNNLQYRRERGTGGWGGWVKSLDAGDYGIGGRGIILTDADLGQASSGSMLFVNGGGGYWSDWGAGLKINYGDSHNFQIFCTGLRGTLITHVKPMNGTPQLFATHYNNLNTTKAADGTLKAASPVIKIFSDGRAETNLESEGATVKRLDVGQYLITDVLGMNSDTAWGGIDGGFDIPTDRNKQPLIWLDYDINPDGSILVKTYHRTYPDAPAFARNLIGVKDDVGNFTETAKNGDPVDIPSDQFVSVRVEMPGDSIYNQRLLAAEKAIQEAARLAAVEAALKAAEEAQSELGQS